MQNNVDKQYFKLINYILKNGVTKKDRTGTGTISVFDYTMRFNMSEGFPLLTSKKMHWKGIITELIWFLKGDTNIKYLVDNGCNIWVGDAYKKYRNTPKEKMEDDDLEFLSASHAYEDYYFEEDFIEMIKTDERFAKKWGELGPVYGKQWRNWNTFKWEATDRIDPSHPDRPMLKWNIEGIDQIQNLINDLRNNPDSRRLMVSAWNVADIENMTLPPCHYGFQCYTQEIELEKRIKMWCDSVGKHISFGEDMDHEKLDSVGFPRRKLSLKWTQRSVDSALGLPYNIASYAILLHLLSQEVNMIPDELIFSGGDVHIYLNQIDGVKTQLTQETFNLPKIQIEKKPIFDINTTDINIIEYKCSKAVKMPLSN